MSKNRRRFRVAAIVAVALGLAMLKLSWPAAYAAGAPNAPSGLVAAAGDGSVTVSFAGSTDAGTSPILYYRVSIFLDGNDTDYHADGTTSPITVSGLPNGVPYTAKVKARNSSGFGTSSKPTPAFVPSAESSSLSEPTTSSTTNTTTNEATNKATTNSTTNETTSTTTSATSTSAARVPGDVLDLRQWRLNLPIDSKGGTSGESALVRQPEVFTYTDPSFAVNEARDGVVFTAFVDGATTENSKYARSELRELSASGSLADWRARSGTHTMTVTASVDHLPANKPQVSVAQIHGSSDLPLIVMATGSCDEACDHDSRTRAIPPGHVQLMTKENDDDSRQVLDPDYALGSRYTLTIQARAGDVTMTYTNLASGFSSAKSFPVTSKQGLYFKAGCYTLSNGNSDAASAYGRTTINALSVTHTS